MVNLGKAVGYLDLDAKGFNDGMLGAKLTLENFTNSSTTTASKLTTIGSTMATTGMVMTAGLTVPLGMATVAAVRLSANFEAGMSKVQAIAGATGEQMVLLKDKAIEMGAKTKFSATESADAFTFMAQAGWTTDDMLNGIEGTMALAAASGESLATATSIVTDSLTAFGLGAEDAGRFSDVLAKAANTTNVSVSELGESMKYVAPVAGALGYSVEDVSVALGLMANSGIKGSEAGTALRSVLTNLAKPTADMKTAMDEYNISLTDSEGKMLPLNEVLLNMKDKFAGLTPEMQANLAATLAGKEGMSGLLAIMSTSDEDFATLTTSINDSSGAAKSAADIMQDNLLGSFEQVMGGLESLAISFGDMLTPKIKEFADNISSAIDYLNGMTDAQKEQILQVVAVIAALGPLLLIGGKILMVGTSVVTAIASIVEAVAAMGGIEAAITAVVAALGEILPIILVIVGAIALLVAAWKTNFGDIQGQTSETVGYIISIFQSLYDFAVTIITWIKDAWESDFLGIATMVKKYMEINEKAFGGMLSIIKNVFGLIANILNGDWTAAFENIKGILIGFWDWLSNMLVVLPITILGFIGQLFISLIELIVNSLVALGTLISEKVSAIVTSIIEWFQGLPGKLSTVFTTVKDNITTFFTNMLTSAILFGTNFVLNIVTFFQTLPQRIWDILLATSLFILQFTLDMIAKAIEFGANFIANIIVFFQELPGKIWEWLVNTVTKIEEFKQMVITKAIEIGLDFINSVINFFSTLPARIGEWLAITITKIIEFATNVKDKATDLGKAFVDNIITFVKELPGKIKEIIDTIPGKITDLNDKMKQAGKDIIANLLDGIKDKWADLTSWFNSVKGIFTDFFDKVDSSVTTAKTKTSGSHANGLERVPYDGYIAQLHKDERVLTKTEASNLERQGSGDGDTFIFYNTQPTPYEYSRQFKEKKRELELGF